MRSPKYICAVFFAFAINVFCNPAIAQEQKKPWTGTLSNGEKIHEEDLKKIIYYHQQYIHLDKEGKESNLYRADIRRANLQRAVLKDVNLQRAIFEHTNLQEADLSRTNLYRAVFSSANLQKARLPKADLRRAFLEDACLQKANLGGAKLQDAYLPRANLQEANLSDAKMQGADLCSTKLQKANFHHADLQGAKLWNAGFQGAKLRDTCLKDADIKAANLEGVLFELRPNCLPDISSIAIARNLSLLKYKDSPHALVELREALKKFGLRRQEREVTYAIKRSGYTNAMKSDDIATKIQVLTGKVLFDFTCQWGMSPCRPFVILAILIIPFSFIYMLALIFPNESTGDGIWKVWLQDRTKKIRGSQYNKLLRSLKGYEIWGYGFFLAYYQPFISAGAS